jgi:WD40 repeat protein
MRWTFLSVILLFMLPLAHVQTQSAEPLVQIQIESQFPTAYGLAWSPNGEILAVSAGGEMIFYNSTLDEVLHRWAIKKGALNASWSPDGKQIAVVSGFRNHDVIVGNWDAAERNIASERVLKGASDQDQYVVSWSLDGTQLATLADDRKAEIQFWDMESEKLTTHLELPYANPLRSLIWDTESMVLTGAGIAENADLSLFSIDSASAEAVQGFVLPQKTAAFDRLAEQSSLASVNEDGWVRITNMENQQTLFEFQSVTEPTAIAWRPAGDQLAVLSYHGALELWDTTFLTSEDSTS